MSDEKSEKTTRRWIVEATLPTQGGENRKFCSRPLTDSAASDLVRALRDHATNIQRVPRRFTSEELEEAGRLAEMGRESAHLGRPD